MYQSSTGFALFFLAGPRRWCLETTAIRGYAGFHLFSHGFFLKCHESAGWGHPGGRGAEISCGDISIQLYLSIPFEPKVAVN